MARLLKQLDAQISQYRDRRFEGSQEEFDLCLRQSTTVYVGNLSFYTTEEQIYEVFSKVGDIKRIIMGLDKTKLTPCGFCFVVYYTREDTEDCVKYISGMTLDDRPVRADFDWGFKEGRQFGRGRSGGQVRDEYRVDYDAGRGGYGQIMKQELTARRADIMQSYSNAPGDLPQPAAEEEQEQEEEDPGRAPKRQKTTEEEEAVPLADEEDTGRRRREDDDDADD